MANMKRERGVATLLVSLVLLVGVTMVTVYTAHPIRTEQQVTANESRNLQALNAGEAGVNYFLAVFQEMLAEENVDTIDLGSGDQTNACRHTVDQGRAFEFREVSLFDRDKTLVATLTACSDIADPWDVPPQVFFAQVTVRGFSDDLVGRRDVSQLVRLRAAVQSLLPGGAGSFGEFNPAAAPLVARGNVSTRGNIKVEGTGTPIIAGGTYTKSGQAGNIDYDAAQQNDPIGTKTEDQFFEHFFGDTKQNIKSLATVVSSGADLLAAIAAGNTVLWFDGDFNQEVQGNAIIGSMDQPITLIVEGNFKLAGTQQLFGTVYAESVSTGNGNINLYGSLISENDINSTAGNVTYHYDDRLFGDLGSVREHLIDVNEDAHLPGIGGIVPGTWRDF